MIRLSYKCAIAMSLLAAALPQSKAADVVMPVALASLQPGQWQLRSTTAGTPPKTLCIGDPRILLQLRHGALSCNRFIITNEASYAVVNYSCAGTAETAVVEDGLQGGEQVITEGADRLKDGASVAVR